ncbi:protein LTO1 homolog isoform X1 [Elephas maximus indicus]|uniref:protein LTO1 homolog isoform X1 n=1 Tax=Elephas maximus indicus TaxID=99487 RepID=UPI002116B5D0|nr:protein LTO1 homolog isoform X1 [Elephas maximus indicus]
MAGSQDMFDAIVMADERFHGEGYQEGYEEGSSLGIIEGRQYGALHGAKIGSEIGCYQGFAFAWKYLLHSCATKKDSKKMKVLESLIGMIQKFPYDDPAYDKLHEDLDKIRGKFKQAPVRSEAQVSWPAGSALQGFSGHTRVPCYAARGRPRFST